MATGHVPSSLQHCQPQQPVCWAPRLLVLCPVSPALSTLTLSCSEPPYSPSFPNRSVYTSPPTPAHSVHSQSTCVLTVIAHTQLCPRSLLHSHDVHACCCICTLTLLHTRSHTCTGTHTCMRPARTRSSMTVEEPVDLGPSPSRGLDTGAVGGGVVESSRGPSPEPSWGHAKGQRSGSPVAFPDGWGPPATNSPHSPWDRRTGAPGVMPLSGSGN